MYIWIHLSLVHDTDGGFQIRQITLQTSEFCTRSLLQTLKIGANDRSASRVDFLALALMQHAAVKQQSCSILVLTGTKFSTYLWYKHYSQIVLCFSFVNSVKELAEIK